MFVFLVTIKKFLRINIQIKVIKVVITELQGRPQGPVNTQSEDRSTEVRVENFVLREKKIRVPINAHNKLVKT